MAAYSVDFRAKIVAAYEEDKTSIRKVAERFMVSKGVVQRLLKQKSLTGDITPRKPDKAKQIQLVGIEQVIIEMVAEHPELCYLAFLNTSKTALPIAVIVPPNDKIRFNKFLIINIFSLRFYPLIFVHGKKLK
ncbi:COG3415 family protein [Nostoc sp.]|uniref:hypothetical protein n=1 Tax=Nostoc sp. TaxID=1180 RepID=UPI002FF4ACDB